MAKKEKHRYYVTITKEVFAENDKKIIDACKIQEVFSILKDEPISLESIVRKDFGEVTETEIYKKEA